MTSVSWEAILPASVVIMSVNLLVIWDIMVGSEEVEPLALDVFFLLMGDMSPLLFVFNLSQRRLDSFVFCFYSRAD